MEKIINFKTVESWPLLIPEQCCEISIIGRACLTVQQQEICSVEILKAWYGVNVPTEHNFSWHFKAIQLPQKNDAYDQFLALLETAAIDAFIQPQAIMLPDELSNPLSNIVLADMKPHKLVS